MTESVVPKHDHATLDFPKGFLWGAATSGHQVEGNNIHSDWWAWEKRHQPPEKQSGEACDEYNRFEEDFDLVKDLGHNAHRLGIEWARIEPKEGQFDFHEIEHYKTVLKSLKSRDIKVMLTLYHFTLPEWVAEKGGWENRKTADYFGRFIQTVIPELKDCVDLWITINEPQILTWGAFIAGIWPPQKKSNLALVKATWNLVQTHKKAYKLIHQLVPNAKVGIANNVQSYSAYHKHSLFEQLGVIFSDLGANHLFYFFTQGYHDFLGLNYYMHHRLRRKNKLGLEVVDVTGYNKEVTDLGWEIFPEGIFEVLTDLTNGVPIYITECGIATSNDDRRIRFLMQYLQEVNRAIKAGANIKGFFYWSLIDNFEWADGYDAKFGLVEIDFKSQRRTPRPSAFIYKDIIKHNGIRHDLMKFLGHRVSARDVIEIPGVGPIKEFRS